MLRNEEKRPKHEMVHRELRSNQPFNRSLYCLSMPSLAVFLIIAMIIQMNFIRYIFLGILRAAPSESEHFSLPLQVSTPPITSVWPAKATGSTVIAFDANETKSTALRVFSSHNSSSKRTAAIVLFGIPKEFPVIWKHYEDNLIRLNPNVTFSVTIHLYNDVTKLTNLKNNEFDVDIESEDRIAEVLRNYHPTIVSTKQADVDQELEWITSEHVLPRFHQPNWTVAVVKNMFRQGFSIRSAFHAAPKDGMYLFLRSDTLLFSPIILPSNASPEDIYVPGWQGTKDKSRYIDRLAICGSESSAGVYAEAKWAPFLNFVRNISGTFESDGVPFLRNSERMLRVWLDDNSRHAPVRVKLMPRSWAQIMRIRGEGKVDEQDMRTHVNATGDWTKTTIDTLMLLKKEKMLGL
jgi:hypothetical protein